MHHNKSHGNIWVGIIETTANNCTGPNPWGVKLWKDTWTDIQLNKILSQFFWRIEMSSLWWMIANRMWMVTMADAPPWSCCKYVHFLQEFLQISGGTPKVNPQLKKVSLGSMDYQHNVKLFKICVGSDYLFHCNIQFILMPEMQIIWWRLGSFNSSAECLSLHFTSLLLLNPGK